MVGKEDQLVAVCHFLSNSLVNQQKMGEIKTLKIFRPGQESASFENTKEPQGLMAFGEHLCTGSVWEKRQECHGSLTTSKTNTRVP